jgi:hypothetical protein
MRMVDHAPGRHRGARHPVHLHPFEQEAERFAHHPAMPGGHQARAPGQILLVQQGDGIGTRVLPLVVILRRPQRPDITRDG